jgi:branched-subunit amino acid transport protein
MTTWIAVVAVGVISYALRAVPLFSHRLTAPDPHLAKVITDAGVASSTAIVVLSLRADIGRFDRHSIVVAGAFAIGIAVARRGRTLPLVVASGMASYAVLTFLLNQP